MRLGFGELELAILNALKGSEGASVAELLKRLPQGYAYTTIMTVCKRLEEKGALQRRREGRQFLYRLKSSKAPLSKSLFSRLKSKVFGSSTLQMVSFLIEHAEDVDEKELREVEELIRKKRKMLG